jgi:hypothetical protein
MKKRSQAMRILDAMIKGERISRLWAAKQFPIIAQPTNRCNEILAKGIPVQKKKNGNYMEYFLTPEYIQQVKDKIIDVKYSPI